MESELPDEAFILGVDEHTAVRLDLGAGTASVTGTGTLTVRRHGQSTVYPSGSVLDISHLGHDRGAAAPGPTLAAPAPVDPGSAPSLQTFTDRAAAAFDTAAQARDAQGCVAAILDLEQALADWSADTGPSDERPRARAALRSMVLHLGGLSAPGTRNPGETVGPFVECLLELRHRARTAHDYAGSDWIRDRLAAAGVEVRDTPDGAAWQLRDDAPHH